MATYGVNIREQPISPPSVREVDASGGFVVGTAPGAKTDGKFGKNSAINYNEPFLLTKRSDAKSTDLGTTGTLPKALDSIFAQGNTKIAMVIVHEGADANAIVAATLAATAFSTFNDQAGFDTLSGTHWALISENGKKYLAFRNAMSADETKLAALVIGRKINIKGSGGGSVLKTYTVHGAWDATKKRIEVNHSADHHTLTNGTDYDIELAAVDAVMGTDVTRTNAIGHADDHTGIYAALSVESKLGFKPRLLSAPGMDTGSRPGMPRTV